MPKDVLTFFPTPAEFRKWLEKNHLSEKELMVGFYKKGSGHASITWPESVREALCFGWIDGVRRGVDEKSYSIHFTPRKSKSIWSKVNIAIVEERKQAGKMWPAGLAAYEARDEKSSGIYSFEQGEIALPPDFEAEFRANAIAWENFHKFPPSYRKPAIWKIISAKQDITKRKRLAELIENSQNGRKVPGLRRNGE